MSHTGNELSNDVRATMAFSARRKSVGLSYLLWFFLGTLGVHRFYLGSEKMGAFILSVGLFGWIWLIAGIVATIGSDEAAVEPTSGVVMLVGLLAIAIVGIILLVDLFRIPDLCKQSNERILDEITSSYGDPA